MEAERKVIVDTDILIKAYRGDSVKIKNLNGLKEAYCISVITAIELMAGAKGIKQLASLNKVLKVYTVMDVNEIISRQAFLLFRKYVLNHRLKIPDCFVAATALHYKLQLYTDNVTDFDFIRGIKFYKER